MKVQGIAEEIKKTLQGIDKKTMFLEMSKHYKILRLMDEQGNWASASLQKISKELLPEDISEEKSKAFVDEMANLSEKNPYLIRFLNQLDQHTYETLGKKVKEEGLVVFPGLLAYSQVLERLTKAMYHDPQIIKDCRAIFNKERKKEACFKEQSLFHKVKFLSVEVPIKELVLKSHNKGVVEENASSFLLPMNILEATFADFLMGQRENAKAGWTLAINGPRAKAYDPRTGEGPAKWSPDKKAVTIAPPLPKEWNDLYQTWNMAFVSQASNYPYVLPKLLIPQVAKYQEKPNEYMYNRVLALYLYLNYAEFESVEKKKAKSAYIDWADKDLTKAWGSANLESALDYNTKLKNQRKLHKIEKNISKTRKRSFGMNHTSTQENQKKRLKTRREVSMEM